MGIYDREYYRREGPSFLGSFTQQGKVCKWLIALNAILFIITISEPRVSDWLDLRVGTSAAALSDEAIARELGPDLRRLSPEERQEEIAAARQQLERLHRPGVLQGQVWRLLTYSFLHAGLWHILFNMLFLWWFGHEMEDLYGSREFLIFYLVSALLGGAAYTLWAWARGVMAPCVGASGAVMAVMILYAFHYPRRVIYLWFFLPIPIWLFVAFEVLPDFYHFVTNTPTQTAVVVHLAGAAFGFAYYKGNWRLAPLFQALTRFRLPQRRPRLRIHDEPEPVARRPRPSAAPTGVTTAPPPPAADEHLEAAVDAVLEKVARSGRDSLTESEKALLVRASEVYKRKQRS
jgi:membrane associated rhomboid family serine protease